MLHRTSRPTNTGSTAPASMLLEAHSNDEQGHREVVPSEHEVLIAFAAPFVSHGRMPAPACHTSTTLTQHGGIKVLGILAVIQSCNQTCPLTQI